MEAPSKMTTLTPSVKFFKRGTNASKPVSSFTTKTMRHIRHSSTAPKKKKTFLIKITAKVEKNALFGRTLTRIRATIEKTPFWVGLCLELKTNNRKTTFLVGLWLE